MPKRDSVAAGDWIEALKGAVMIVLAFVACMQASPDVCREYNLMFGEQMSPMTCLMQAQPRLAEWVNTHPDWQIGSWRCGEPHKFGTPI